MRIQTTCVIYVSSGDVQTIVPQGTYGTEMNGVLFFPNTTRNISVGFHQDDCLQSPMFKVQRNMEDSEISKRELQAQCRAILNQDVSDAEKLELISNYIHEI